MLADLEQGYGDVKYTRFGVTKAIQNGVSMLHIEVCRCGAGTPSGTAFEIEAAVQLWRSSFPLCFCPHCMNSFSKRDMLPTWEKI